MREPLGHVAGALLVADEDVADGRVDQRVVHGQDRPARQPEHDLGALHLEALDEGLGSRQFHWSSFAWSVRMGAAVGLGCSRQSPDMKSPPLWRGAKARRRGWRLRAR